MQNCVVVTYVRQDGESEKEIAPQWKDKSVFLRAAKGGKKQSMLTLGFLKYVHTEEANLEYTVILERA